MCGGGGGGDEVIVKDYLIWVMGDGLWGDGLWGDGNNRGREQGLSKYLRLAVH